MAALHPLFTAFNKLTLKVHHCSVLAQFVIHFLICFPNSVAVLELKVFVHSNSEQHKHGHIFHMLLSLAYELSVKGNIISFGGKR
jgi:hypothetical protein